METLPAIFFTSFIIGFSGAAMPGPMLTVTIRESAKRGFIAGPMVVLGHAILEIATIVAIYMGLGAILTQPLLFGLTGLVGGAILIWMGYGMFISLPKLTLKMEADGSATMNPVLGGVVTSLSNPYFPLWWATAGLTLMTRASALGMPGQAAFFTGHILSDLVWYSMISGMMHFGRSFLTDGRYRLMVGVLALMLIVFGLYFGFEGAGTLTGWIKR